MSNNLNLTGIHHVSARTRQIGVNHDFYTRVLNLRLVKKSVNQDDTRMYHLFLRGPDRDARQRHDVL
jgi:glyoxalase family protein